MCVDCGGGGVHGGGAGEADGGGAAGGLGATLQQRGDQVAGY